MLLELSIRQFAIIEELKINFNEGLNILTGETGAGKSIIIDAIHLIAGGRGSVEYIRNQAKKAELEALVDITDNRTVEESLTTLGIDKPSDGLLVIRRELLNTGKSICRINGQLVTLGMLKEVGQNIIQIYSQFQNQQLLSQEQQLNLVDAYGDERYGKSKREYIQLYRQYDSVKRELKHLLENEKELAQRLDLLHYQINEITEAELTPGEEEELNNKRFQIRHSEKIIKALSNTYHVLSNENGITELLSYANGLLDSISSYDGKINEINDQVTNTYYQFEDITNSIHQLLEQYETSFSMEQLNEVEERLDQIQHLKRKYGENINAILEYAATIEEELEIMENKDEHLSRLQQKLQQIEQDLIIEVIELSNQRKDVAQSLSKLIENELKELEMKNAHFHIQLENVEDMNGIEINGNKKHIDQNGIDKVTFLFSPNPGEPLKPLQKIASGGELSRIMLAVQTILAHQDEIPIIIFDEVDTGVSGRAAQAIAEKLAIVGSTKQVFVITHVPQVASMGDYHYLIEKRSHSNVTYTEINMLNEEKRIEEISRMIGGIEITDTTKQHAREILEIAKQFRIKLRQK